MGMLFFHHVKIIVVALNFTIFQYRRVGGKLV